MLGAEPVRFSWTVEKKQRKPPTKRKHQETPEEPDDTTSGTVEVHIPPSVVTSESLSTSSDATAAGPSGSVTPDHDQTEAVPLQTESDIVLELQRKIASLEIQLADCQKKCSEAGKENTRLLERQFSLGKIKGDNAAVLFYTGFPSYEALMSFYSYLEPKLCKMQYWKGATFLKESQPYQEDELKKKPGPARKLTYLDEFLLVLMRLKAGLFVQDLADRFGISTSLVSRICITWINLLYFELKNIFPFPSQELVRKNMPKEFAQYATTRIILDCTELFIQRPSAMLAQSETWSDYKHHNTWKLLVGVTPNGQVTFLSDLWGGRVSDKQITRESGVLDLLEPGDNVMVDRGFDISGIVPAGVTVNMPPFLAGRDQMSAAETEETMSIASVRIHVERAIGRLKTYHILDGTLPNTLSPYATQIATVCGLLTNFLPPLLPPSDE